MMCVVNVDVCVWVGEELPPLFVANYIAFDA